MPKASKQTNMERTARFQFLGDEIAVTYRLGAMGPAYNEWFSANRARPDFSIADVIEFLVVRWNMTDDTDQEIPPTRAAIEANGLLTPFLNAVHDAIQDDASPNRLRR